MKAMSVYRDTDLQHYKLEPQLSLLPEMVQAHTSRFDIADRLDFSSVTQKCLLTLIE